MKHFFYNNHKILLDTSDVQTSASGRPFRLSGVRKNCLMPQKWVDKELRSHWIYMFIFLDNQKIIEFEFDCYENLI